MIPLFKNIWKKFWHDEQAATRWVRGLLLWAGGMAVSVLAYPWDDVRTWNAKEWLYRVAAAGALGIAGTIVGGQKNRTPEEIRAELDALKWDGKDRRTPTP